jgi:hypothetical protein
MRAEPKLHARIGRLNGWWYVSYRRERHWGRCHYGSMWQVICAAVRVWFGASPAPHMRPFGDSL